MSLKKTLNLLILAFLFLFPLTGYSAEILQINTTNDIVIGDQNRELSLTLPCIAVEKDNERLAVEILKKRFPRGTKIKIKPFGLDESILSAKISRVDNKIEMTQVLISNDLAKDICANS